MSHFPPRLLSHSQLHVRLYWLCLGRPTVALDITLRYCQVAVVSTAVNDFREAHTGTPGMTRYEDHLDDMPAEGYAHSAISLGRTESFQALYFGHIANYQSRGVFNAPEQLSLYGDGVRGKYFADSFRAGGSTEVDVDLCVPSTMLPAIMGRWMFSLNETATRSLFRAAPRRFFRPSTSSAAISLLRAPTRYGRVSAVKRIACR